MIPSIKTCFYLMEKYQVLENIKAHSVVVAKVAHLIARGLRGAGFDISVEKTSAGALMHDIGKTASLTSGQDHSELGRRICIQNNFDEIAGIVAEHVRLKDYDLDDDYSEKEIVFYADKRVNHDAIVTLEDRLAYILERYSGNQERLATLIRANFALCKQVEKKLFTQLNFGPDSLSQLVKDEKIVC
ncbi:MAG: HD domain-containing protein [Desulfobacterales bacterium]|nr:HD domain-containing protein [Desulfobacterales bacterium]